ncbi:MAG: RdgB/HAM1 family non-canonical purine NTP pyrophosphatase [Cyclobacteriaceae bacterium]|nr:RdgB/HAM1 family non-canonical purine NTP pyrophosphatase [Cyclobacteriaceae bacterium]
MTELCFVTHNPHKVREIRQMLGKTFRVLSLDDIGYFEEIPENQQTLEGNSFEKAKTIFGKFQIPSFADDTGLEVPAINNEPGIYSARYAGPQKNSDDNIDLLLRKLIDIKDRKARFRTVITLIDRSGPRQFEGIVHGKITRVREGSEGFGYDPVFIPEGYQKTFAQLMLEEKNRISHRGIAFRKLVRYLQEKSISDQ